MFSWEELSHQLSGAAAAATRKLADAAAAEVARAAEELVAQAEEAAVELGGKVGSAWETLRLEPDLDPAIGEVGGDRLAHPPRISHPRFGRSMSWVPTIARFRVDTANRAVTNVGSIVKPKFFPHLPDFVFNVCFAVGHPSLRAPQLPDLPPLSFPYGDPTSIWFNVFVGYYQLDAPKSGWTRPFAYVPGSDAKFTRIEFDDIVRLGKADWNYFSNYLYGVPADCIEPFDSSLGAVSCANLGRVRLGSGFGITSRSPMSRWSAPTNPTPPQPGS